MFRSLAYTFSHITKTGVLLALLPGLFLASGCNQHHHITAKIDNLEGQVLIQHAPIDNLEKLGNPAIDTITSEGGLFTFNLPNPKPHMLLITPLMGTFLRMDSTRYHPRFNNLALLVRPEDRIEITGNINQYYTAYHAKGSKFTEDLTQLRSTYIEEASKAVKIELSIDSITFLKGDREVLNQKFQQRNELYDLEKAYQLAYIKNNTNSELAAYFLMKQPLDTLAKFYSMLGEEAREGSFSEMLRFMLNESDRYQQSKSNQETVKVGRQAKSFSLESADGKWLLLDSLYVRAELTVLDFWGSWCAPCINGFPQMKSYYEKYKGRLEIVAIACQDTRSDWTQAIIKYQLPWINLIDHEKDRDNNVAVQYGVMAYPTKFIINSEGSIVGRFVGEQEEFYSEIDRLLR